jgi:VIT1/CCC1 family predicted Fe2+/Mn2+ transporter
MPPGPPHDEKHLAQDPTVRDLVIGAADGLILPFALAAALAGTAATHPFIVTAGLAAIAAGCVALGLGRHLAARNEAAHYAIERRREEEESVAYPDRERWEVAAILHRYGVRGEVLRQAVEAIAADRKKWVDFMMRFELELTEPDPNRATKSAATIAGASVIGGLIPLLPYMILGGTGPALAVSVLLTGTALLGFGWLKARASGHPPLRGALQTLAVGGVAALVAYLAASLFAG